MTHEHSGRTLRTDIQGLRALAVGMVVVYHLHAPLLPGGFVGVDVFFVISGFLITAHLLGRPPMRPRDLLAFWYRRIRRLLPASLVVLATTLLLVRMFAPETQWEPNARDARAAALYFVNWSLADRAVDYLAEDNVPTAVQHFWSLSVEEQFYFVWPVLVGLVFVAARRFRLPRARAMAVVLTAVVLASLWYSVARTASDPAAAYFVTPTRIWELASGGLLALGVSRMEAAQVSLTRHVRRWAAWLGLAMVVATGFLYSSATPFPGYQAGLPVVGTLLVILAAPGAQDARTPGPGLARPSVQWVGLVSYSVYLWHWPLIVVLPYALGQEPTPMDLLLMLMLTVTLAALTERYVERPFRAPRGTGFQPSTYVVAAAAMAVVVFAATMQLQEVEQLDEEARTDLVEAIDEGGPCLGAEALDPGRRCDEVAYDDLVPAPGLAAKDRSNAYADVGGENCWAFTPDFPSLTCTFGRARSDVTIALVGNSHAGQWLPALEALAEEHGWRVDTYLASQCASADTLQTFETPDHSQACRDWVRRTTAEVAEARPDLVVMSNRISVSAVGHDLDASQEVYGDGFRSVLARLREAQVPVLAIRDTPAPGMEVPTCVAENADDLSACDGTRDDWLPADPVVDAVEELDDPAVRVADLTDHLCEETTCRSVNGGVITYFDASHITATYAHTLAPYLEPHVVRMVG